ncbi:MAG TPA: 2Fe-2S iron-sulfur cluster-binding protein [Myxococcales bacterium]|nr:2Fe-2S iron-sulfur cluster-binding protein [Myxococcales bacterium]
MSDHAPPPSAPPRPAGESSSAAVNTGGGQPGAAAGQAQIPAPPKKVKVFVDGVEVEADARDNLIEAARRIGVAIPYFCYHPRLSIAAQCRICLVETSDAPGRLVPGCQVRVKEGLKIITTSPAVKDNQRGSMEFHLVNHPVDCAICDQSGECKLQDYYMEYDHQPSRIGVIKLAKPKREIFGPQVVYDAERCIMCTRCVRFMDEIAKEPQLAVVDRGTYSLISTFPGQPLDSKYSGNTVDICPVGALLNRDFRFQSRVWFVNKSPTICTGCSNGCNVYVESRGNVVYRLLPRRNEEVNQVWMCDEGRLSYHATNEKRVQWARTGRGDNAASVGPRIAVERAAEILRPLAGQGSVGIALSAQCTNEEATAAFQIGKQLRASRYFFGGQPAGDSDDFLIRADKNPNTRGVQLVAEAFGVKLEDASGIDGVKALVAMRTDGLPAEKLAAMEVFIAIAQNEDAAAMEADVTLPCESVYEQDGTLINWYGRLQRTWDSLPAAVGDAAPGWSWAKRLLDGLGGVGPTTAADAFRTLAELSPHLAGFSFDGLPDDGIVIEALLPAQWPARAPRPLPGAHSVRGPQTTPPGMKVGDEASGGSR